VTVPAPSLAGALDQFAEVTTDRLADTVLTGLAHLREPATPTRFDRALHIAGLLAETLAGFACGGSAAELIERMRSAGATTDRDGVRRELAALAADLRWDDEERRPQVVLADAQAKPLVDELGIRLLPLILRGRRALHRLACELVADLDPAIAIAALAAATASDASAMRLGDQMIYGWQTYGAAIWGGAPPAIAHERSRELWRAWLRRLRRERIKPVDRDARELGYVLRVA
jgi:hypothetical protein